MEIIEAICTRRSIRSFKPDPVPREVFEELLDACRWAPSGGNAQPWHFAVLGGEVLDKVKARLKENVEAYWDGTTFTKINPDLPRTVPYPRELMPRTQKLREQMNAYVYPPGTEDVEKKQEEHRARGQRFFDAPNAIIIYCDDASPTVMGAVGIASQTICLAALAYGLGTCIMGQPIIWPDIYRELLGVPEGKPIATAIAIGYPDTDAPVNNFPRPRESMDVLVDWHGV
jgi:nitroreductase